MKKLRLDELREQLQWPAIVEEQRRVEYSGSNPAFLGEVARFGVFRVKPSNRAWPDIRLVCDPSFRSVEQVEFSAWDGYDVDGYERSLGGVVHFVADLVHRVICVVEEIDSRGECLTASLLGPNEAPDSLYKKTTMLRRVLFDREPRDQEIDFDRYVEWHGELIERGWAEKMGVAVEHSASSAEPSDGG